MCAFKAVYSNNNIFFEEDTVIYLKPKKIFFKDIELYIKFNYDENLVFECDINAPINKIYKLCSIFHDYNFIIIFRDYQVKYINKDINISNNLFYEKKIIINTNSNFYASSYIKSNDKNNSEDLVTLLINKLKSINLNSLNLEKIELLQLIADRTVFDNIYSAKNFNILFNLLKIKINNVIDNIDFDSFNSSNKMSLINELNLISKFKDTIIDESVINKSDDINIFQILKQIIKMIYDDKKIKDIEYNLDKYNDDKYTASRNLYYSVITRTNWIDELEYGNIVGLLVKIDPKDINKNAYNLDFVPITDITHTVISLEQLIEAYKIYYSENKTLFDDKLGLNIISGFGVGNGNCIIPLYITKDHWELVNIYSDYNNGLIFNRNPMIYKSKHMDVYYNVTMNMINLTFCNDNYNSDKWIQLLFSMIRTTYEISHLDNLEIQKFINSKNYRIDCNINKILMLMLFEKDDNYIKIVIEEQIRRKMKSIYKNIEVLDDIYNFYNLSILQNLLYEFNCKTELDYDIINDNRFNELKLSLEDNIIFSKLLTTIHGIISIRNIIKNDYIDLFSEMDENAGVLQKETVQNLKEKIINNLIRPTNYNLHMSVNPSFSSHTNITKKKKFTIDTLFDNQIIKETHELKSLLIQSIIQRVDKCRKKALLNDKYYDPFKCSKFIIRNTGLLINSRFIKKFYNVDNSVNSYINLINNISQDTTRHDEIVLLLIHLRKSISLKNKILESKMNIKDDRIKDVIESLYKKNLMTNNFEKYQIFLT